MIAKRREDVLKYARSNKGVRCEPHLWVHEKDAAATAYYLALIACNWDKFESYERTALLREG